MKHSLVRLCGAGALVLPLSVWASAQTESFYNQAATGSGTGTLQIFNRLQSQEQDINQLRGQIEELRHQLEQQTKLSQQRYLDLEERLSGSQGDSGASSDNSGNASGSGDPITQAASGGSQSSTSSSTSASSNDAQGAYQAAFSHVQKREFDQAISAFEAFNRDYPQSGLNGNAWYWLGELYSAKSQLDKSSAAFSKVISDYPQSNKVPDAMYKLGLVYARQGKGSESQNMLKKVISEHSESDAAGLAREFMQKTSG
ncbi:tol-pal system protein YbgF [Kushneria marisflavi]|uniref:Cell division coordinator CpoB n=1 Tax=Kushneria marisflavi TaxID=157779 RepID=A0A240UKX3_9GAMM|nr:tol-pal system protein YbgF [Kushneria marisflavi]ART61670.1 tol-pal system protein YbgF [Kushneria marisflavi]RKD86684.1 tol-pal system protein YbgF [Kushneria marisflavi]